MAKKSKTIKKVASKLQLREPDGAETADCLVFDEATLGISRRNPTQQRAKTFDTELPEISPPPGMDADEYNPSCIYSYLVSLVWLIWKLVHFGSVLRILWRMSVHTHFDVTLIELLLDASNLKGKERNKYLVEKSIKLGGHVTIHTLISDVNL